jgi:Na+/H+ antiporter NhaD/arsenite permease-like protein
VVIFGPLIILICQSLKITPIPYLMAAALLSDTGGVATLVGDPPNLMIGSAFGIDFNTFLIHMGGIVLLAWFGTLFTLRFIFRKEFSTPAEGKFEDVIDYKDKSLWNKSLFVLGLMVVLFVIHGSIGWQPWMVSGLGLILLVFLGKSLDLDEVFEKVEMQLLIFFIALFMIVGGVEGSQFLEYLGQFIIPFVQSDLFMATLILMWVAAVMSAAIDNIPFTAAMIPIIASIGDPALQTPLLWALALGVGMGGNGTHIGSTANVFIVTISERLAKDTGDPSLAITPLKWFKYGLPVMIVTLIICSVVMTLAWDFYAAPLESIIYDPSASGH